MNAVRLGFIVKTILAWVVVPFLLVELVVRVNPNQVFGPISDGYAHLASEDLHPIEFDSELGWVPRPGRFDQVWDGRSLNISPGRLRSNGRQVAAGADVSILAVGDSFTFGDWVADDETWPSYLEKMLGATIYNAGVSSYGFDQAVLRAGRLVPQLEPDLVIVSLIEDDISRTEVSSRSNAEKPFYRLEEGALVLDSAPLLPFPSDGSHGSIRFLIKSSSALRLVFRSWLYPEHKEHEDGLAVSCLLTKQLAALQQRYGIPILLLAEMKEDLPRIELVQLQRCAEASGLDVIDTYPVLSEIRRSSPDRWESLWDGHMSAAGNRVIAEIVYDYLQASSYALLFEVKNDEQ